MHAILRRFLVCLVLTALTSLTSAAIQAPTEFSPGEMFRANETGVYRIPVGGGDFSAATPFAAETGAQYGQFAFKPDLSVAYLSTLHGIIALAPDGTATPFATGFNFATGLLWTSDGRLLAADFGGTVKDITAGGDAALAPVFASGLHSPRNMIETTDGRILIVEQ